MEAVMRKGAERDQPWEKVRPGGGAERMFQATLQNVRNEVATPSTIGAPPVGSVEATGQAAKLQSEHGIGVRETRSAGDAILGGLKSIRGMFDEQIDRAAALARTKSASNPVDLILAQAEVAKLTVLIDTTSKLAGKFTQSCDTLLKG